MSVAMYGTMRDDRMGCLRGHHLGVVVVMTTVVTGTGRIIQFGNGIKEIAILVMVVMILIVMKIGNGIVKIIFVFHSSSFLGSHPLLLLLFRFGRMGQDRIRGMTCQRTRHQHGRSNIQLMGLSSSLW
jgi:hypothetical protein